MLKALWYVFCAIAGAVIGAVLLGLGRRSVAWAIVGAVVGLLLGIGFARLVPAHQVLIDLLG
ncbi:MAG: hypothetical protein RIB58_04080 [Phycisphaerales bacterium]|jgi:hypothetical protein